MAEPGRPERPAWTRPELKDLGGKLRGHRGGWRGRAREPAAAAAGSGEGRAGGRRSPPGVVEKSVPPGVVQ